MKTTITLSQVKQIPGVRLHHESWCRGYISRRSDFDRLPAEPYNGRFGHGWKVLIPSWWSTSYCRVRYYVVD